MLRFFLGMGIAVALGYAAVIFLFFGIILVTGCFWACNQPDPQPVLGLTAFIGAAASAGGVVTSVVAALVGRRAPLRTVFVLATAAAAVFLVVSFVTG